LAGERSGLFFEIMRLAKEIKPKFIFLENVPAITTRGGLQVVNEIASLGYDCRWCVISAASVGALHRRERWFCLAHSNIESSSRLSSGKEKRQSKLRMCTQPKKWDAWPENESSLLGVDAKLPFRLDRTKALGNSVCVIQTREAFKELMGIR
jgi:DNA (cytosine-5)-methyltransferase 1